MPSGFSKTLKALANSANEAAVEVLVAALDSPRAEIAEGALQALLQRRSPSAHRDLLKRWSQLDERWKAIIADSPHRFAAAVRDAILGNDEPLWAAGCAAVLELREYDLLPALINAAENDASRRGELAAQTVLSLTESLHDEMARPSGPARRDPQAACGRAVADLERSVGRFAKHGRREILDAFLMLANRDNATLKKVLHNPHERSFLAVMDTLTNSTHVGVLRLLLSYLDDPRAPSAAINVLAHRRDTTFLQHVLKKIGFEPTINAAGNFKRMKTIHWLRGDLSTLDSLADSEQHAVVQAAMASGMNRLEVFEVIARILRKGTAAGRRAASAALVEFGGAEANQLAQACLNDDDPQVQAHALAQLRPRGIPGSMTRLLEALDSPHAVVRRAAQECLEEFKVARFLAAYDMMDEDVRRSTGLLVRKVDPQAASVLSGELSAKSRTRRLRALGVAATIGCVPKLEDQVISLLADNDYFVRAEAARVLVASDSSASRQALRQALLDGSVAVREAAQRSLEQMIGAPMPPLVVDHLGGFPAAGVSADE